MVMKISPTSISRNEKAFWFNSLPAALISCFLNSFVVDVTKILSELELAIQRVKVTTTPDDRVLDLFFITDNM